MLAAYDANCLHGHAGIRGSDAIGNLNERSSPCRRLYTRAPAQSGRRGLEIRKTPVHSAADSLGIPVLTPTSLRDVETQKVFKNLAADVALVAAYGLLLPLPILEAPTLGCVNLHASLLPRWRGAAPIQRARCVVLLRSRRDKSPPVWDAPQQDFGGDSEFDAKGYLLPDFCSGATVKSGRFIVGLLLRRLHCGFSQGKSVDGKV
jgi:formyl transferase-like protein